MKLNRYGYLIGEGFRNVFTHGFMSFASVTIIIACLIVMGSFTLLDINVNQIVEDIGNQNQILAYVDEDMTAQEATAQIQTKLEALDNVASVNFVSRSEARQNFLEKYGHKIGKRGLRVAPEAEALLLAHSWPGNIRELENVIERAVILTTDGLIRPDLLPPAMQAPCALCSLRGTLPDALEQLERQLITEALQEHRGNMGHAAQALGISERVMGLRMRKFGLGYKAFRRGAP